MHRDCCATYCSLTFRAAAAQIPLMLETLAKLVNADKLRIDYTEYELCDEFSEALEHAQVRRAMQRARECARHD